jgi:hypothetical protein
MKHQIERDLLVNDNWIIPFSELTTLEPSSNEDNDSEKLNIKWFKYNDGGGFGDSEVEKAENSEAIKEQISMGILIPVPTADGKYRLEINDGKPRINIQQAQPVLIGNSQNPRVSPVLRYVTNIETSRKRQGPNELCACGSGKKFKKCHGR